MDNNTKISFRQKEATACPVCGYEFHREELFTGGGRLIAGKLTDELRRNYDISKKYGEIIPLAYMITVCPKCYYAAYPKDFPNLSEPENEKIKQQISARLNSINKFFGPVDFNENRDLVSGAASFMLAVDCYSLRDKFSAPTFKKAVSSIRAAWLFSDLAKKYPEKAYKKISVFFYKKAYNFYSLVLELIQNGGEPTEAAGNMGPDADKNWGYDGILYLTAILTLKVGARHPEMNVRVENLEKCKRYLSKLFGIGKTSKSRPSELLDMTRDVYDKINQLLEEWSAEKEQKEE